LVVINLGIDMDVGSGSVRSRGHDLPLIVGVDIVELGNHLLDSAGCVGVVWEE
jgi:hypothetical protein